MNEILGEIVLVGRSVQIDQRTLVDRVMMFRKDNIVDLPVPLFGGLHHFGLVKQMVNQDKHRITIDQ